MSSFHYTISNGISPANNHLLDVHSNLRRKVDVIHRQPRALLLFRIKSQAFEGSTLGIDFARIILFCRLGGIKLNITEEANIRFHADDHRGFAHVETMHALPCERDIPCPTSPFSNPVCHCLCQQHYLMVTEHDAMTYTNVFESEVGIINRLHSIVLSVYK